MDTARCCWKGRTDKRTRAQAAVVSVNMICVGVSGDCGCRHALTCHGGPNSPGEKRMERWPPSTWAERFPKHEGHERWCSTWDRNGRDTPIHHDHDATLRHGATARQTARTLLPRKAHLANQGHSIGVVGGKTTPHRGACTYPSNAAPGKKPHDGGKLSTEAVLCYFARLDTGKAGVGVWNSAVGTGSL